MAIDLPVIKRVLIGKPFPTSQEIHERLDKVRALAVFASDPISSNAYATEAIMSVIIVLGSGALRLTLPLAIGVLFALSRRRDSRVRYYSNAAGLGLSCLYLAWTVGAKAYIERFQRATLAAAREANVDGVVCGHIHRATGRFPC